jgi:hypothetical protein
MLAVLQRLHRLLQRVRAVDGPGGAANASIAIARMFRLSFALLAERPFTGATLGTRTAGRAIV